MKATPIIIASLIVSFAILASAFILRTESSYETCIRELSAEYQKNGRDNSSAVYPCLGMLKIPN